MKEREELLKSCHTYVNERILRLETSVWDLERDLGNETKSSAGDKYETSREMINAEISQLESQLQEFKKLQEILQLPNLQKSGKKIQLGSIVTTSAANYFLAIPAGEIKLEKQNFYGIGINSPIAKLLLGKQKGDRFNFHQEDIKILSVD
ncbi:transcription elongation factor [Mesonia sp. MT50]|uniref:Transcription elongation factor n=1 Tax=Mesonia profundi TaxID=3070998 RepID=A0ABU0ZYY9_9FLAO|nr:transcription elongation factor [Mesonia profundi]MDQ7916683.1 transcription elongation factor [Mesonia profundi]